MGRRYLHPRLVLKPFTVAILLVTLVSGVALAATLIDFNIPFAGQLGAQFESSGVSFAYSNCSSCSSYFYNGSWAVAVNTATYPSGPAAELTATFVDPVSGTPRTASNVSVVIGAPE